MKNVLICCCNNLNISLIDNYSNAINEWLFDANHKDCKYSISEFYFYYHINFKITEDNIIIYNSNKNFIYEKYYYASYGFLPTDKKYDLKINPNLSKDEIANLVLKYIDNMIFE